MEYKRVYWVLFVGCGLLLVVGSLPAVLAGTPDFGDTVSVVGGAVIVGVGVFSLSRLPEASGPEEFDLQFLILAVAFVLLVGSTLLSLL